MVLNLRNHQEILVSYSKGTKNCGKFVVVRNCWFHVSTRPSWLVFESSEACLNCAVQIALLSNIEQELIGHQSWLPLKGEISFP